MKTLNKSALKLLNDLPDNSVDFILTDPPYILDLNGGEKGFLERNVKQKLAYMSNGFDYKSIFAEFERVLKIMNLIFFCSNKQLTQLMSYWEDKGYSTTLLIWRKPNPIPYSNLNYISDIEFMIYVRGKGAVFNVLGVEDMKKTFTYPFPSSRFRIHNTEKPIRLLQRLLQIHTKERDTVLDPFAGSFTTAIACYYENRDFIGCEIDKEMYDKAINRLNYVISQTKIF